MTEKEKEELKLKNNALLVAMNSVILICFTLLAIVFNKWWIIFFSIPFLYYKAEVKKD